MDAPRSSGRSIQNPICGIVRMTSLADAMAADLTAPPTAAFRNISAVNGTPAACAPAAVAAAAAETTRATSRA
jgi:hypothetical protein